MWLTAFIGLVWAQDTDEAITVVGQAPEAVESSASVTVVEVDETVPASADVGEVLERAPGTVLHRLGGLGDWSAVSIRGASARQVEILLDGVPLNPDGMGAVNLSELPITALSEVQVYRGLVPPELGSNALGGVVNLISQPDGVTSASVAAGSYQTGRASALVSGPVGSADGWLAVEGLVSGGRYAYFDDGGTELTATDDGSQLRQNNDKQQLSTHGRVAFDLGSTRVTVLDALLIREAGVPGPVHRRTEDVRYGVFRNLTVLQAEGGEGPWSLLARAWVLRRDEALSDPAAEIGSVAQDQLDTTLSPGIFGSVNWAAHPRLVLGWTGRLRGDQLWRDDRLQQLDEPARRRAVLRSSVWGTAWMIPDHLSATAVLEGVRLDQRALGTTATRPWEADPRTVTTDALLPRLGVRAGLGSWVVKGNVGQTFRPPGLTELFGDTGTVVGRPDLRPERGTQVDLGLGVRAKGDVSAQAEVTGFVNHTRDLVVWVQNAQGVSLPTNIGRARILGVESAASVSGWDTVDLLANATFTDARNRVDDSALRNNQLPRIPRFELQSTVSGHRGPLRGGYTLSWTDGNWWDATNWYRSAPRVVHSAFLRVRPHRAWSAELDVLNLANTTTQRVPRDPFDRDSADVTRPVTDFQGYPLPGRTVMLALSWEAL